MCEEFEFHQDRSGQPDVLMGQSIVLSEIKAEIPLQNEIPSHQNVLLQQYEELIKLPSQENKVSKFCMDAGFGELVVNTLFHEMTNHHNQKDGFRETQELDPYWKSRPVICTVNMELKLESGL